FLAYRKEKRIHDTEELIAAFQREVEDVRSRMKEALDRRFEFIEDREATKAQIESEKWKNVPAELVRIGRRVNEMGRVKLKLEDPSLSVIAKLSLIEGIQEDPLSSLSQLGVGDQVETGNTDIADGDE